MSEEVNTNVNRPAPEAEPKAVIRLTRQELGVLSTLVNAGIERAVTDIGGTKAAAVIIHRLEDAHNQLAPR